MHSGNVVTCILITRRLDVGVIIGNVCRVRMFSDRHNKTGRRYNSCTNKHNNRQNDHHVLPECSKVGPAIQCHSPPVVSERILL